MSALSPHAVPSPDSSRPPPPRPIARGDIPRYARLFCRVFRHGDLRHATEIEDYMAKCLFDAPGYSESHGPMVQEDGNGNIAAVIGFIPLPMIACGREMTARLGTAFLSNPDVSSGAAGRITTLLRAKRQDFIFSNTGADMPARAVLAGGGLTLPFQSLDFTRIFRPAGFALENLSNARYGALLRPFLRGLDACARRLKTGIAARNTEALDVALLTREEVLNAAPEMIERFAVRPRWHREELNWLLDMAATNAVNGPLLELGLKDAAGTLAGIALCYARPGGKVVLLNLLTLPGYERAVTQTLFAYLDAQGHTALRGEAQPWLMSAIAEEPSLFYRFRGHFMVLTRHADVAEAVRSGDFYAGGLFGEIWCRLVDDYR